VISSLSFYFASSEVSMECYLYRKERDFSLSDSSRLRTSESLEVSGDLLWFWPK